jgi:cell division protein FtsQ
VTSADTGDGRDPELEALLNSFGDADEAGAVPVPDVPLDELLQLFGAGPDADPTAPLDATEQLADGSDAGASGNDVPPVADVPVETGIDWLGAPVFGSDDGDATRPIALESAGGGRTPAPDGLSAGAASDGGSPGAMSGAVGSAPGSPVSGSPESGSPESNGTPDWSDDETAVELAEHAASDHDASDDSAGLREIAIPIGHVGVVAVDQETGEMLAPFREEELPTGKAFFGRTTIVITDDEGPDIGYLDDEIAAPDIDLDGSPEVPELDPNTIYIGDKDEGFGTAERAPTRAARSGTIDPRVRARRSAVRRQAQSRRLVVVGAIVGLVVMLLIAVGVVASPMFGVTEVRVNGAVYTDAAALDAVITDLEGEPVLLIDTGEIEAVLSALPWVERVRVDPQFPHTVVIDIRERRALATFRGGDGRWRVIDVQGRVLDVLDGQPVAYMPITGSHPDTSRGQYAGTPYASAATLVQVLPAEVRAITQSVGLDAVTGTLTMELVGGVAVRLGSADDLDDKLARLLSQVRGGLAGVVALDVSTAQIGVVRG